MTTRKIICIHLTGLNVWIWLMGQKLPEKEWTMILNGKFNTLFSLNWTRIHPFIKDFEPRCLNYKKEGWTRQKLPILLNHSLCNLVFITKEWWMKLTPATIRALRILQTRIVKQFRRIYPLSQWQANQFRWHFIKQWILFFALLENFFLLTKIKPAASTRCLLSVSTSYPNTNIWHSGHYITAIESKLRAPWIWGRSHRFRRSPNSTKKNADPRYSCTVSSWAKRIMWRNGHSLQRQTTTG